MSTNRTNKYAELGFTNRTEYLDSLAEDYGIDEEAVYALADVLGEDEDFDGLLAELSDLEWLGMFDDEEGDE